MSRPVRISSKEQFYATLTDYPIVFAMFYVSASTSTKAILPIYEDLCRDNSTSSIAFIKVNKAEYHSLCHKYGVPLKTNITFMVWKYGKNTEALDGDSVKELEQFVHRHAHKPKSLPPPPKSKTCDCHHDEEQDQRGSSKSSPRPPRVVVEHIPHRHRHHVPLHVRAPSKDFEAHKAYPAHAHHRHQFGPFVFERPARFEYTGQDGHRRVANDLRIQQGEDGRPEATYMDHSGPLDVERTI